MKNFALYAILAKIGLKFGPVLLKLFKSVKVAKVGLAGASVAAYSYLFTWEFALILLLAIIIHEYGHLNAMKKMGIPTKGMYLIPFVGGAAVASETFKDYHKESYVSIMGPVYGIFSLIPFVILYMITNNVLFAGLVSFIALLNLFNLLPINPLDGGRVIKSIAFSLNTTFGLMVVLAGLAMAAVIVWKFEIYLLLLIIIIGLLELIFDYKEHKQEQETQNFEYRLMNKKEMFQYSSIYIGLIVFFVSVIFITGNIEGADIAFKMIKDEGL